MTRRTPEEAEGMKAARAYHNEICRQLKDASDMLSLAERVAAGTYVQDLVEQVNDKKRAEMIPNGYFNTGVRRR